MAAPWQKTATVGSILQIGISQITKCAIYNDFCKSSHKLYIYSFSCEHKTVDIRLCNYSNSLEPYVI